MTRQGFVARLSGLWHMLCGHQVQWRVDPDACCAGDIVCDTCDLLIWCRAFDR